MNTQAPRHALTAAAGPAGTPPAEPRNLRAADWLYRSKAASVLWLVARIWLGYGFATAGVTGSKAGTGGASYGWFAGFLHGFVIPNASWIAVPSRAWHGHAAAGRCVPAAAPCT
jgi:hypothetical protein